MLCFWNYCCLSSTLDKCRQKNGRAVRISFTLCKSHFLLSSKAFLLLFSKDQWPQKPRVLLPQKHQHPDRVPQEQFSSSAAQEQNRTHPAKTEFLPSEQCPAHAQWPGSSWLSQQQKLRRQHLKKPSPTVKRCLWGHGLILPLSSCPCPTLHTLFPIWGLTFPPPCPMILLKRHLCSPQPSKGLSWRQRGCSKFSWQQQLILQKWYTQERRWMWTSVRIFFSQYVGM